VEPDASNVSKPIDIDRDIDGVPTGSVLAIVLGITVMVVAVSIDAKLTVIKLGLSSTETVAAGGVIVRTVVRGSQFIVHGDPH
jgi:hypothetical protein